MQFFTLFLNSRYDDFEPEGFIKYAKIQISYIFLGLKTLTHLFLVQPFSTLKNIRKA